MYLGSGAATTATATQDCAEAAVHAHMAAINACERRRIVAQYPADVEISPDGVLAQDRDAVAPMFARW
jgi:hypothetical protein